MPHKAMDSYDLFGDDGASMLEGLPELGATDHFEPAVTGARDATQSSSAVYSAAPTSQQQQQQQQQPSAYAQDTTPLQKLASFGGSATDFNHHMDPNAAAQQGMYAAQGYGGPDNRYSRKLN